MKTLIVLVVLFAGGTVGWAQAGGTPKAPAPKAPAAKAVKKEEPPPKIEGIEVARPGGFLGVQVVDGKFRVSFYDAKKKPVAPNVARAMLRWDPKGKTGQDRAVLTPGGGPNSLASDKYVRPPYNFKLFITLMKEGADEAAPAESYVIDFRQ